jgi:hypothetical protein
MSANNGTLTASAPVLDLAQTWNNAAVAFTAINLDITNTASFFGSQFLQFSIAGVPQVRFQRNFSTPVLYFGNSDTGIGSSSTTLSVYANGGATASFGAGGGGMNLRSDSPYSWASSTNLTAVNDLSLFRDAADTLAQRRTTNPQTFRIYNTYTDASNFERLSLRWASNVAIIGTEKGLVGGSARALELHTGGAARLTISSNGANIDSFSVFRPGNNRVYALGGNARRWTTLFLDTNIYFGDTTSASDPQIKKSGTTLQVKLADDSAFTAIQGKLTTETAYTAGAPTATGYLVLYDSAGTAYKVPAEAL